MHAQQARKTPVIGWLSLGTKGAAKAIGIKIPTTILVRADEVLE